MKKRTDFDEHEKQKQKLRRNHTRNKSNRNSYKHFKPQQTQQIRAQ